MKLLFTLVCVFLVSSLPALGQVQPSNQPESAHSALASDLALQSSQIDPAKEADIRRLLDLTGAGALATQSMDGMEGNIRPLMTNSFPPGEYREKLIELFFAKFHAKRDPGQLLDIAVPIYDKYYSDEEIKQLIHLYQTPIGKKLLSATPKVMGELQQAGEKWGEAIGRQSMLEVLAEHPELEKALQDAQKTAHPQ